MKNHVTESIDPPPIADSAIPNREVFEAIADRAKEEGKRAGPQPASLLNRRNLIPSEDAFLNACVQGMCGFTHHLAPKARNQARSAASVSSRCLQRDTTVHANVE